MALNYIQGNVLNTDPTAGQGGPFPSSNVKDLLVKVIKINPIHFGTTRVDTLAAVLPADASIVGLSTYVKTQLFGGSISGSTMRIGTTPGGADILGDGTWSYAASGAMGVLNGGAGIGAVFQNYNVPLGQDIRIYIGGTAVTGNPTSGEMYLVIQYIR